MQGRIRKKEAYMYKIGICDDEKNTCMEIEKMVREYAKRHMLALETTLWHTGEALCEAVGAAAPDLLFLDIELVTTSGIEVGRYIRNTLENHDLAIAYISSKSSYAMELFKIRPIDFLIKPIRYEDVAEIMEEALKLHRRRKQIFEYHAKGIYGTVQCKDILYFSSDNKKINIMTPDGVLVFNGRLRDILPKLPDHFIQIHQSYIINLDHMRTCTYESVTLTGGVVLNISQPYRKEVRRQISEFNWGD